MIGKLSLVSLAFLGWFPKPALAGTPLDALHSGALEYRLIGPFRGGRAPAVVGVRRQPFTFFMGTSGGGVWKTTDAGRTWANVSDPYFEAGSIGAIAVAESDENVVYVGTGEANLRGDVQTGVGLYKSEDGGRTWRHSGLAEAGQIGGIRVHPRDPDLLYVAVLGHAFGPNEQRGVYRSSDGGATWTRSLYVSDEAGAVGLAMDPSRPDTLYATVYQVVRKPWVLVSGGEDSGLYKTTDGGESWTKLEEGLPTGLLGRMGVAVSTPNPERVWVIAEADDGGGLYRSDDGGSSFVRVNRERKLVTRAFYFSHVFDHPVDENTVYVLNIGAYVSIDGGGTFESLPIPHGDAHDLWIHPDHPHLMINGNDGGATVSLNAGETWSTQLNQPTAELYRVTTDDQVPYRLYGSQQDNTSLSISSARELGRFRRLVPDIYAVGGGEQGHIWVSPVDPNIVYAGEYEGIITRYDHRTGEVRNVETYPQLAEGLPASELRYRFQMNAPIRVSPHDPAVLYHTSQYVHRSRDEGQSWEIVSPDLTRDEVTRQGPSGGPITKDHTGPETYCTVFAFEESPHRPGLFWTGSDDGLVHVSKDGGATWENVTPEEMPEWATVNMIELSSHDPGRAWLAVHRYRLDDFQPYLFRTNDYGKSWQRLTLDDGVPARHFVRVVREDPERKGLLYLGTEFGIYVSFDDGESWESLRLNLPVVQIADLVVKDDDLVVATHGRSFWVLDDLAPLREWTGGAEKSLHLFTPEPSYRRDGARVYYTLPEGTESVSLELLATDGSLVRSFTQRDEGVGLGIGLNRFDWDARYPAAATVEDAIWFGANEGPLAVPGTYRVRLRAGDRVETRTFEIQDRPDLTTTPEDYRAQLELALSIRDALNQLSGAVRKLRSVREQVERYRERAKERDLGDLALRAGELARNLTAVEEDLMQTKNEDPVDVPNFPPKLDAQLVRVLNVVLQSDTRPTDGAVERFADLRRELEQVLGRLREVIDSELSEFNRLLEASNLDAVSAP